jgi:hypothetical protein
MAGELIRKASGVVAAKLSYDDFVNLAKGVDVLTNKEIFKVNWETLTIEIVDVPTRLKDLTKNARLNISFCPLCFLCFGQCPGCIKLGKGRAKS